MVKPLDACGINDAVVDDTEDMVDSVVSRVNILAQSIPQQEDIYF